MEGIMNRWISISIIAVLAVGLVVSLFLYFQESGRLKDARLEIVDLEGTVSILETDLAAVEAEVSALETDLAEAEAEVSTLETDLAAAEAEVSALEQEKLILFTNLAAAEAEVSALETDLAAAEAEVSALETDLAAAEAEVSALETDLAAAEAEVSALETDLAAAEAEVSALSAELQTVKDPRHFTSLQELEAWLAQDNTDIAYPFASSFERAYILQVRALRDGYLLPANFEDIDFDFTVDFVGNLAYIGNEIYYVWAGDDSTFMWASNTPPLPPHPLPLD
jgi:septal ring factor EnvC (AmiA/AmiB activator)